jgi:glycosyltransferase involved in cell wall biosynthesis
MLRRTTRARLLYNTHDLHFLRELRRYQVTGNVAALQASRRLREVEREVFRTADVVLTPSADEVRVIEELCPGTIAMTWPSFVSDGVGPHAPGPPLRDRGDVLFVGSFAHIPNVDAARVLVESVMPEVWLRVPRARAVVVGHAPPAEVQALAGECVRVTGYVPDLGPYLSRARMTVSPLRYGAGVKLKILASLDAGVPVVTTTIGNEGVGLRNDVEALIADDPIQLAECVVRLFREPRLLAALADSGRRFMSCRYGLEAARTQVSEALRLAPDRARFPGGPEPMPTVSQVAGSSP